MAQTQQELRQASVRAVTGTTLDYNGDWMALFDAAGIAKGNFDERMLLWINLKLSSAYAELNGAMQALAAANAAFNFSSLGTFSAAVSAAINFGAKNRALEGGIPTTETANGAISGVSGDFKIDGAGNLVPANSGAGTIDTAWVRNGTAPYTGTGVSAKTYAIALVANARYIRPEPTPYDEWYFSVQIGTAAGGPALGETVYIRTGDRLLNGAAAYFEPVSVASFTGSGRITFRSELVDTSIDANGNANRKHGYRTGNTYMNGATSTGNYPFDFRDIYWLTNVASPLTQSFFNLNSSNVGFRIYNSRFECGPEVLDPTQHVGIALKGEATIDGCYFKRLGGFAITVDALAIAGTASITNNVFDGLTADGIEFAGSNVTITGNFGFGWTTNPGDHADPVQCTGDGRIAGGTGYVDGVYTNVPLTGSGAVGILATITVTGGSATGVSITASTTIPALTALTTANTNLGGSGSGFTYTTSTATGPTFAPITKNIFVNDTTGGMQSGFWISDQLEPGRIRSGVYKNNIVYMGGGTGHAMTLSAHDAPVAQFNTILGDPYCPSFPSANPQIETGGGGINGGTITHNFVNSINMSLQAGSPTLTPNATKTNIAGLDVAGKTAAQLIATYQIAFPNLPTNQSDVRWRSRAGCLYFFTPAAGVAVASGGAMNVDGTYCGALFPAGTGQANGAWNDGTVPLLTDPTWLLAHPAAT